jgi:hypothetical protein
MEKVRSGTDREAGLGHGRGRAKHDCKEKVRPESVERLAWAMQEVRVQGGTR